MFIRYVNVKGCDTGVEYTEWIREHYVFLLENLDSVTSGLIDYLYQENVVDATERDDVRIELSAVEQNERLLSILARTSSEQIQLFFNALDVTGQSHVRNRITGQQGCTAVT